MQNEQCHIKKPQRRKKKPETTDTKHRFKIISEQPQRD